jgi:hypothetical protein
MPGKKKTFILTISKYFMGNHPKAGQPTLFKEKILSGEKIHTIRGNYDRWKMIVDQVNSGEAELSLREWTGKPYRSKQEEFLRLSKLGVQRLNMYWRTYETGINREALFILIEHQKMLLYNKYEHLIKNDGLTTTDFIDWFIDEEFKGAIIHFTDFKY